MLVSKDEMTDIKMDAIFPYTHIEKSADMAFDSSI